MRSRSRGGAIRQGSYRPLRVVEASPGQIHFHDHVLRGQRFAVAAGVRDAGEIRQYQVRQVFPGRHERHGNSGMSSHGRRQQVHRSKARRVLLCCRHLSGVHHSGYILINGAVESAICRAFKGGHAVRRQILFNPHVDLSAIPNINPDNYRLWLAPTIWVSS